jgi:hypothetical protein
MAESPVVGEGTQLDGTFFVQLRGGTYIRFNVKDGCLVMRFSRHERRPGLAVHEAFRISKDEAQALIECLPYQLEKLS